jgi:hypothetical protein
VAVRLGTLSVSESALPQTTYQGRRYPFYSLPATNRQEVGTMPARKSARPPEPYEPPDIMSSGFGRIHHGLWLALVMIGIWLYFGNSIVSLIALVVWIVACVTEYVR